MNAGAKFHVMAGLDPAIQAPRPTLRAILSESSFTPALPARRGNSLDGRVKPGHDEEGRQRS